MLKATVTISNQQKKAKISVGTRLLIRKCCVATLIANNMSGKYEVNVTFNDNEQIRELNRQFRDKDKSTDVLSFPLLDAESDDGFMPPELETMLGDIVISLEKAREQSEEFGHSFEREVAFLTVHSMLHLLGYDHEKSEADDADMRLRQRIIMNKLGL